MKVLGAFFLILVIVIQNFSAESSRIIDYIQENLNYPMNYSGLNAIDQIYVVNLDIRYERWLNIKRQLEVFAIYPKRVAGINGWLLDRKYIKNIYRNCIQKPYDKYLTPGQVGCFLSHVSVLNDAFKKKYKCIWVLEDDVLVLGNLKELDSLLISLEELDSKWDVLFTDVNPRGGTFDEIWTFEMFLGNNFDYSLVKDPEFIPLEDEKFKKIEYRLTTHSMIISDRGIKKLLDYFQSTKISFPIDIQMHCCPDKHFYVSKKEYVTNGTREISDTSCKPNL